MFGCCGRGYARTGGVVFLCVCAANKPTPLGQGIELQRSMPPFSQFYLKTPFEPRNAWNRRSVESMLGVLARTTDKTHSYHEMPIADRPVSDDPMKNRCLLICANGHLRRSTLEDALRLARFSQEHESCKFSQIHLVSSSDASGYDAFFSLGDSGCRHVIHAGTVDPGLCASRLRFDVVVVASDENCSSRERVCILQRYRVAEFLSEKAIHVFPMQGYGENSAVDRIVFDYTDGSLPVSCGVDLNPMRSIRSVVDFDAGNRTNGFAKIPTTFDTSPAQLSVAASAVCHTKKAVLSTSDACCIDMKARFSSITE